MAVNPVVPLPPSQPDVSKLNTFSGYIVNVTKHLAPRGTVGTTVVSAQTMTKEQVLNLSMRVQIDNGPGYYHFRVTDAGGLGEVEWFTKLGIDIPGTEAPMAGPGSPLPPGSSPPPTGEGVTALGHGFFYNEILGTLTTPWRTVHNWKPGEPMPEAPSNPNATRLSLVPPNATPWSWPQGGQPGGWGGYPVEDSRTKQLEQQLAEQSRRLDEEQRRHEQDRRDREMAEMRADIARRDEANRQQTADLMKQFQTTIEKVLAKPAGPSEETVELRRRLEESERRQQERDREERLRGEMQESNRRFEAMVTEMRANKSDPMITMFMQFMSQMNQSSIESVKAIQSATANQTAASERQVQQLAEQLRGTQISPMQIIEIINKSKGDGAEMARMMVDTMKETMGMQKSVYEQLLDVAGQGGQPAWLQAVQIAADKVGSIGEAVAARARMQQQQQEHVQRQQQRAQAAAAAARQPPGAQRPVANGAAVPQPASVHQLPQQHPKTVKGKRGGKKAAQEQQTMPPPPADGSGYTLEQIADAPEEDIRASVKDLTDEVFFGPILLPFIKITREQAKTGMKPEDTAGKLLENRGEILKTFGDGSDLTHVPPAVQLLMADQIGVLVERCLPDAPKKYRDIVVETIEDTLEAESAEEEEEEGDEADA